MPPFLCSPKLSFFPVLFFAQRVLRTKNFFGILRFPLRNIRLTKRRLTKKCRGKPSDSNSYSFLAPPTPFLPVIPSLDSFSCHALGTLSLRRLIERIVRREVHASRKPKRIRIEHRIVGVEHLVPRHERPAFLRLRLAIGADLLHLGMLHGRMVRELVVVLLRVILLLLGAGDGSAFAGVGRLFGVGDDGGGLVGSGVVLLFCTHGINLGRTELYWGKEGG